MSIFLILVIINPFFIIADSVNGVYFFSTKFFLNCESPEIIFNNKFLIIIFYKKLLIMRINLTLTSIESWWKY